MGYRVVKHGNRAVSSVSGAADALEGLGFTLEKDPQAIVNSLKERNFTFQFAPYFHPAFANVGPVRKQLGIRTLFNILGPLINPACPDHLMMGVGNPDQLELIAATLQQRPIHKIAVFSGAGGYDELTALGPTRIIEITDGQRQERLFDPAAYGFEPCNPDDLAVHSKEEAVDVLRQLLDGRGPKPMRDMLTINVAYAISLLEDAKPLDACMALARQAVADGAGKKVLP